MKYLTKPQRSLLARLRTSKRGVPVYGTMIRTAAVLVRDGLARYGGTGDGGWPMLVLAEEADKANAATSPDGGA